MTDCLTWHDDCAQEPCSVLQALERTLDQAEQACLQNGVRLTPLRRAVLRLIWQAQTPVGAYDLLPQLKPDGQRPAAPPTVYRALEFLLEQGLIHRLASMNAYVACRHPHASHQAVFLCCQKCRQVQETATNHLMDQVAAASQFVPQHALIEIAGLCQDCQS